MGTADNGRQPVRSGRVLIERATLRDITYIGAHLRQPDRDEIFCQLPEGTIGSVMAASVLATVDPDWTWVATIKDQPVCAFGFQAYSVPVWIGWAWGTDAMIRAIPAVTRHCLEQEQRLLDLGVRRVEVRTMKGHDVSQAWLGRLGCKYQCDLPDHGRDGETFELWAWQLRDGLPSTNTSYRTKRNVLPQASQGAEAGSAALSPEQAGG